MPDKLLNAVIASAHQTGALEVKSRLAKAIAEIEKTGIFPNGYELSGLQVRSQILCILHRCLKE